MPYSPKHKRDTREKILESARRLFNRNGYSGVSIEEIMSEAGLTHGGFYRHFRGKDELYAAAVRQFLCKKAPAAWQTRRQSTAVMKHRAQRIVEAYFSREHLDDHDGCCPLLGTASDVERRGELVKAAYQEVVEQRVEVFEDHLNGPRAHKRALALVAFASAVWCWRGTFAIRTWATTSAVPPAPRCSGPRAGTEPASLQHVLHHNLAARAPPIGSRERPRADIYV